MVDRVSVTVTGDSYSVIHSEVSELEFALIVGSIIITVYDVVDVEEISVGALYGVGVTDSLTVSEVYGVFGFGIVGDDVVAAVVENGILTGTGGNGVIADTGEDIVVVGVTDEAGIGVAVRVVYCNGGGIPYGVDRFSVFGGDYYRVGAAFLFKRK